jgi:hypothetical protein
MTVHSPNISRSLRMRHSPAHTLVAHHPSGTRSGQWVISREQTWVTSGKRRRILDGILLSLPAHRHERQISTDPDRRLQGRTRIQCRFEGDTVWLTQAHEHERIR